MARKHENKYRDQLFNFTFYANRNLIFDIRTVEVEAACVLRCYLCIASSN